jgi:FAD/FMN-containing dehydrogenase
VSGYENLDQLLPEKGCNVARALVGTECTCVTVVQAELNLVHSPPKRVLAIIGFDDVYGAADAVPDVLGYRPIGLEGIDQMLIDFMTRSHVHPDDVKMLPAGHGWLIAEFGAETTDEAVSSARRLIEDYKKKGRAATLVDSPSEQK